MRAQGRCAGCGKTGPQAEVDWHVLVCQAYAVLYRRDPAAALAPAAEYARWREQDKAAERRAGLARRVADTVAQRASSVTRYRGRRLLED